jgi:prepilin-type N-terminal cleavage/methylation domain-containing protein
MGTDMTTADNPLRTASPRGFSLVELLVVVAIITIVMAAILTQVDQVQQRAVAEQGRVDDFQQARDFMSQVIRDGRQMGYPNVHNFDTSSGSWTTTTVNGQTSYENDSRMAVGLVRLSTTHLQFEGDVAGTGQVYEVSYKINGDGACTTCMERAQVLKVNGNPYTGQTNLTSSSYVQEVKNVSNVNSATAPIFSAYDALGNQITLPVDVNSDPQDTAEVRLIKINLAVASPTSIDPRTGKQLEADISGSLQVVNCSMAWSGLSTSGGFQLTCQ